MKKLFTFIFLTWTFSVVGQDCKPSAGTKTLYKPQQKIYSTPPPGYQPVFINHVGRHGARHLTKDLVNTVAYKLLQRADSLQALTNEGSKLKKMVLLLRAVEATGLKSISQTGKTELQGIAERMVKNNDNIFTGTAPLMRVEITKEQRTEQSADAFLKGLHQNISTASVQKSVDDTALRFYDMSPAYLSFEQKGSWKKMISSLESDIKSYKEFEDLTSRFFIKDFVLSKEDKESFCKDIYGFAMIVSSISVEIIRSGKDLEDLDFRSLFSCKQLTQLSKLDRAEDFLLKGPGQDSLGIQVKIAAPLMVQFLKTSEAFMNGGPVSLQLRFAHAETIAPFAALMQIVPASKPVTQLGDFDHSWKAEEIIPLSANIQWIFYKKQHSTEYLVKFLLNEKEVRIKGLATGTFPFYYWRDIKKFYNDLLQRLQVNVNNSMSNYLLQLSS